MTSVCGSIVEIKEHPEIDGSIMFKVRDFDGEPFEVLVHPWEATALLRLLQEAALMRADQQTPSFPQLTMTNVNIGYCPKDGDRDAGLLVETESLGTIALRGPVEIFQRLRDKAAMAIDYINGQRH